MRPRALALPAAVLSLVLASAPVRAAERAWLPDTAVVLQVADRVVTAQDFVESYFRAYPLDRPGQDSLGRVKFMGTLTNKEVLGIVAAKVNKPLGFEDRHIIRENRQRVLSDALFRTLVLDSVKVDSAEVERQWARAKQEHRIRHILFADEATAKKVRADLVAKRINWKAAQARYSKSTKDPGPEGDLGWQARLIGRDTPFWPFFALGIGEISQPYADKEGVHLVTVSERRPLKNPHPGVRRQIEGELRQQEIDRLSMRLNDTIRKEAGVVYDSANIVWAAARFPEPVTMQVRGSNVEMQLNDDLAEFTPADTGRVLARVGDGRALSLGGFLAHYTAIHPAQRPPVNMPALLVRGIDVVLLEPMRATMAERMGFEKDPRVRKELDGRVEAIRVGHLFRDSIESRIYIDSKARRRYYDAHPTQFNTHPTARFAVMLRGSKAAADSVVARIRAGERPEAIVGADTLAGRSAMVRELEQHDTTEQFYRLVFDRLRPGQNSIEGPDTKGQYAVVHLLSFDPGHLPPFDQVEPLVDDVVRSEESDRQLEALIARHKRGLKIVARPEQVMRIRLVDPADNTANIKISS